jgi:hypothetical protein
MSDEFDLICTILLIVSIGACIVIAAGMVLGCLT